VIPAAVLERGERGFVQVLRRRHPGAVFLIRDGAVRPEDADVPGEILGGATGDLHSTMRGTVRNAAMNQLSTNSSSSKARTQARSGQGLPATVGAEV
jgi:hypothetical protein